MSIFFGKKLAFIVFFVCCIFVTLVSLSFAENPLTNETKLTFLKPQKGLVVKSGETIPIEIAAIGLEAVGVIASQHKIWIPDPTNRGNGIFTSECPIPLDAVGEIKLVALGYRSSPEDVIETEITITVKPDTDKIKIKSLYVLPRKMLLKVGESEQLIVGAVLEDGSSIDVSSTEFGTRYVLYPGKPENTEIIRVNNEGKITAINPGSISLVIAHKPPVKAESVNIVVEK